MGYVECYLETLAQMDRVRDLYERFGFLPWRHPWASPDTSAATGGTR